MPTTAKAHDPERAARWREVFGTDEVPIVSIMPVRAKLPGFDEPQLVYMLNLQAITPEQRDKLVQQTAERFGLAAAEVEADLDKMGMPILADHVVVSSNDIGLLMSMMDDDEEFGGDEPHDPDFPHWDEYEEI